MKTFLLTAATLGVTLTLMNAADTVTLKDQKDKISYSIGLDIGKNLKQQSIEVNLDALAAGLKHGTTGTGAQMTDEQTREVMTAFQKEMMAKQQAKAAVAGDKNKKEGADFLAANKKKEGVKTTASGLQYKVLKDGTGKTPKATEEVTTHYRGTLIDGTEFDSSYKRNEPTSFPVNGVIAGWTEALQLMKEGAKWQLFIPSELAYGERGAGAKIGPGATLIFDIELLSVNSK
jgi:FKBP-type peptidyl-prolyl cis-trans isomerase FklB